PPGHHWNMADLASIAPGAADRHAIMHHGAAEADAEVQIIELADTSAFTIEPHAQGCCDCIDGDKGGKVAHFLQPRTHRYIGPAIKRGGADKAHRLHVERTRHCKSNPEYAAILPERTHLAYKLTNQVKGLAGAGMRATARHAAQHFPGQVHQGRIDAERCHGNPDGITAIRIEMERGGRQVTALGLLAH